MPVFYLHDLQEWVELTDEQVELAQMALADFRELGDAYGAAIRLLTKEFNFTLKHAVASVAYARSHPVPASR